MNASLEQRLARISRYRTAYEIHAEHADGRKYLIAYTPRKGRRGILHALESRLADGSLDRVIGSRDLTWGERASDGCGLGEWAIEFTGRTQREAYIGGELTFLADVA